MVDEVQGPRVCDILAVELIEDTIQGEVVGNLIGAGRIMDGQPASQGRVMERGTQGRCELMKGTGNFVFRVRVHKEGVKRTGGGMKSQEEAKRQGGGRRDKGRGERWEGT